VRTVAGRSRDWTVCIDNVSWIGSGNIDPDQCAYSEAIRLEATVRIDCPNASANRASFSDTLAVTHQC
jgi:hypothetical protein